GIGQRQGREQRASEPEIHHSHRRTHTKVPADLEEETQRRATAHASLPSPRLTRTRLPEAVFPPASHLRLPNSLLAYARGRLPLSPRPPAGWQRPDAAIPAGVRAMDPPISPPWGKVRRLFRLQSNGSEEESRPRRSRSQRRHCNPLRSREPLGPSPRPP